MPANGAAQHQKVREIMRGNAKEGKHDMDAYHVVESAKYGRYFVTNDERILRKAKDISALLSIAIVTPSEFLDQCRRAARTSI